MIEVIAAVNAGAIALMLGMVARYYRKKRRELGPSRVDAAVETAEERLHGFDASGR